MNLRKRVPQQPTTSRSTRACAKNKIVHKKSQEESESEKEFEVEKILDKKVVNKKVKYFLKWKGYSNSQNTWVDKNDLNCSQLIKEFERKLKKEKADKENVIEKRNDADVLVKKNLKESKKIESAYRGYRKNSLDDFIVKDDCEVKHITKNKELHEYKIDKTKYDDPVTKHIVKNVVSNEQKISRKKHEDSYEKHTRRKEAELNVHEIIKKKHYNDSREKLTSNKNTELKKQEVIQKKPLSDSGRKHTVKNVELNEHETVKKRHNDSGRKRAVKNVGLNEHETVKKRHNDYGTKHTKNVESNEHEVIKRRHDGLSRKKPEVAKSSTRNRHMPKIQNLQYFVKSSNFPKKRKKGMLSVMRVSFQGTDVLKGLEHFVEAGIAAGPLPDYLYDKPIKTGATEFQFTV